MTVAVPLRAGGGEATMGRWFTAWRTDQQIDVALLIIRLALGVVMMAHGAQKLFGWFGGPGFDQAVANFASGMGIPPVLGGFSILVEFLAGLAVALGLLTRLAALGLAGHQVVAATLVHAANGFFMNWAGTPGRGHGVEMNLVLIAMALALVAAGSGRYGVDAVLGRQAAERP
jgi:putative oxidoreductase